MERILAFFMTILAFFSSLFGGGSVKCREYMDLSYGEHELQTMDLFVPEKKNKSVGLIIMLHGGTWQRGDKSTFTETAKEDASAYGVACATINYHLTSYSNNQASIKDMYNDITLAIQKSIDVAAEQGVTINKVMLKGFSAGAHLALCYAYNRAADSAVPVVAVYAESAVCDMTDLNLYYNGKIVTIPSAMCVLGSLLLDYNYNFDNFEESLPLIKTISPAHCVKPTSVPTILVHGKQDEIVPFSNTNELVRALKENGVKYDFIVGENAGHGLGKDPDAQAKANKKYKEYINNYLK